MRTIAQICFLIAPALIFTVFYFFSTENVFRDQLPKKLHRNLKTFTTYRPKDYANRHKSSEKNTSKRVESARIGVMKMGLDEGEKFFPDYWLYEAARSVDHSRHSNLISRDNNGDSISNASMVPAFRALLQSDKESPENLEHGAKKDLESRSPASVLMKLQKRDFRCPIGTNDCSAIGYPNSCCPDSDTCFAIKDTGLGPVGCCRKGSNCGGTINECIAPNTGCSSSSGGGCCIRNYICARIGCTINPTMIVSTIVTVSTMISSSPETSIYTSISTLPIFTETSSTQSCHEGSNESGCISNSEGSIPGTATGDLPVRPTSFASPDSSESLINSMCPTGFYACKAYHEGGCCRTGRNCEKTSCPPTISTSLVTDGVTIVVPVGTGASTASPSGTCAVGWSLCGADEGKGCCPSGWKCGSKECYDISATATATISKELPSSAWKIRFSVIDLILFTILIQSILIFA
ncbi:putative gpi anchored protein [Golovinomyces cichoracearum]|uniref:Putative gpi anchored protein n=1 Tax=Golovinomyces cichoracearum TaxID=62708 RepID=A0A420II88_9PEZI|nr:putative gpi anchored protein [Golovinomyces cichoracearum]